MATPLQRGLLTAVFWLAKPKYTINVATNRSEAVNAAVARLRQESVEVPQADVSRALVAPYAACEREQRRRAG